MIVSSNHTFRRAERLKSRKIIQTLFREGKAFSVFPYKVFFHLGQRPHPDSPVQAGFAVSARTFPRASDRNRIKRLGREAWRQQKQTLYRVLEEKDRGMQVFFVYTGRERATYQAVYDKFSVILTSLIREIDGPPTGKATKS